MAELKPTPAVVYNHNQIIQLLAEKHGVPVKNVMKTQYSFIVVLGGNEEEEKEPEQLKGA